MIKILISLSVILILLLIFNCQKKNNLDEVENWKVKKYNYPFIKYSNTNKKFFFYDGMPSEENFLEGNLFINNNEIGFFSKNLKINFKLFDFKLKKNECEIIRYKKKTQVKRYYLCNQDIFFDNKINDTIYKFFFKNYHLYNLKTGIVFFVSKKNGILGHYLVDTTKSEQFPSISEKKWGEIFPTRYDYSLFDTFSIK